MFLPNGGNVLWEENGLGIYQSALTREEGILFCIEDCKDSPPVYVGFFWGWERWTEQNILWSVYH